MAKLSLFEKRRRRVRSALLAKRGLRARLSVHRSGRHIYAQVIDDEAGKTIVAASTLEKDARGSTGTLYWEGAVRATGPDGTGGRGYLELTGYSGKLRF